MLLELGGAFRVDAEHAVELDGEVGEACGVGVEDRDVARDLVGDVDLVALLGEADERAAHGDHVVVGVGGEDDDALGEDLVAGSGDVAGAAFGFGLAAGPAGDGVLKLAEDGEVDVVGGSVLGDELLQAVFVVVLVGELEDGRVDGAGEPEDGLPDHGRGPADRADEPGQVDAGEVGGGGLVEVDPGVVVILKEARGDRGGDGAFDGLGDDGGLALAEGHEDDLAGVEDRADAHGDGAGGHVLDAEEVAGGVHAGELVEPDHAGPAVGRGAGLVEPDVSRAADAQELDVDAAGLLDGPLVPLAVGGDLLGGERAVGDVHVLRIDVDVVEEMLVHEPDVALQLVGLHREVLVEVERHHVLEREAFLLVQPHELVVHARRRRTRGEPEHGGATLGGPLADELGDPPGDGVVHLPGVLVNVRVDPLSADHLEHVALSAVRGGRAEYSR